MINQHDYMMLRQNIEPVFYDDMSTADSIIKAIQAYQEDENFVPKVENFPNEHNLKMINKVIFTIDSASMDVNYNVVHYDIELIVESTDIGLKCLREYRIKVTATCKLPEGPIYFSGYSLITRDACDVIPFIEKGMFDKTVCNILGGIAWRIQQYCLKAAKKYIVKANEDNWRFNKDIEKYLTEPPKPIEFDMDKEEE